MSTIIVRHRLSDKLKEKQWKPIDLANEVNSLPYADDANASQVLNVYFYREMIQYDTCIVFIKTMRKLVMIIV